MVDLAQILESRTVVRFQDCDPYQHLNNSNYLDYFLNAREDQIALHYGLDAFKMAKEKSIGWVVGGHQIAYLKPAFFMDTVVIQSQLIRATERSVQVEMRMYNNDLSTLQAVLWTTFVHLNIHSQSTENHSPELMDLFQKILLPVEAENFDARILGFRAAQKGHV